MGRKESNQTKQIYKELPFSHRVIPTLTRVQPTKFENSAGPLFSAMYFNDFDFAHCFLIHCECTFINQRMKEINAGN